jgi:threonine dehydrogenase-like Zn-dependent dehydrogenase
MRATLMYRAGDVRIENVPDARLIEPTDALITITAACICGSDLWPYKELEAVKSGRPMGHEAIGRVEAVGTEVRRIKVGDLVVMPFAYSDGTCAFCHESLNTSCVHGGFFGVGGAAGGAQAEAVRVPLADGTLFALPVAADGALMHSLLTLSDVMGTGHHAAASARVSRGKKVAVIGDGAVGLCGVIAAKRLGAEQIIILGHYPDRIALAKEFGATDVVRERGEEGVEHVRKLAGGTGVHSVLECVGTEQSILSAVGMARPGASIGRVGVPHYTAIPAAQPAFFNNISVSGGPAPVRAYMTELLPDILEGKIQPGRVFDRIVNLDEVPEGYRAMNDRESIKVLVTP